MLGGVLGLLWLVTVQSHDLIKKASKDELISSQPIRDLMLSTSHSSYSLSLPLLVQVCLVRGTGVPPCDGEVFTSPFCLVQCGPCGVMLEFEDA